MFGNQSTSDNGRTLAVGDIHGSLRSLNVLLDVVRPNQNDTVVALGDYIDRGLDSAGVIARMMQLAGECRLVALRGNHEEMMLDARNEKALLKFWLNCGGEAALMSYSPESDNPSLKDVPDAHWHFLEHRLLDYYETDTHIFVHGGVVPDLDLPKQSPSILRWQKFPPDVGHQGGKIVICGHTPQKSGKPRSVGHTICIDTDAGSGGPVTCLDVAAGKYVQAAENGDVRAGRIE